MITEFFLAISILIVKMKNMAHNFKIVLDIDYKSFQYVISVFSGLM